MSFLPDTATRRLEPELMDDPGLACEPHLAALRGLARINFLSRSARSIWRALRRTLKIDRGGSYRVLDIACGAGDVGLSLHRRALRDGVTLRVDGCDLSTTAIDRATTGAREQGVDASFFTLNAVSGRLPAGYDAIVSNLFLHHLTNDDALSLLRRIARASPAIVVNDLARGPYGYAGAVVGTRLLSRSSVVHFDGPQSVRAAFTIAEARTLSWGTVHLE